jgi:serine/threonine protein kinase
MLPAMASGSPTGAPIDRYVVLKYLAEGGMGAIYLGKKLGAGGFEKEVVLKQLLPEYTRQPEFIDLFLREARLSATLDHANIIHTIDLVTAGDEYFIVMEYLDGADLRTLLKRARRSRAGRMSAAAGVYVAREVLSALAYAHSKIGPHGKPLHLIHRDVSPSNILLSRNGEVKLTDFGIAKASTHNSVFYRVKGKVGYMSPEQARNLPLDHRSDLYSLAVCVYEVIAGERLFVHAGLTTTPDEIYSQPIELLSRKVPGLPAELDKVMLRALAVDPAARYQTAGELQEALLRVAHRHGLLVSAPELAEHLREVCGPGARWRDGEGEGAALGAGTEIYDEASEGTERLDVADADDELDGLISVVQRDARAPVFNERKDRQSRQHTSITNLSRLRGLELTSMINISGLADHAGARPLVDLEAMDERPSTPPGLRPGFTQEPRRPLPAAATHLPLVAEESADDLRPVPDPEPVGAPAVAGRANHRPWLVITLILLAGIGVAAAIGLSGPKLGGQDAPAAVDTPEPRR